jgi:hypothetical protein
VPEGLVAGDMAVDLVRYMGEMALDLAQFRARQGAARDETKEIMKRERESKVITY